MNDSIYIEIISIFFLLARGALLPWFYRGFANPRFDRKLFKYGISLCWFLWLLLSSELWHVEYNSASMVYKQLVSLAVLMALTFVFYRVNLSTLIFLCVTISSVFSICLVMSTELSELSGLIISSMADRVATGKMDAEVFLSRVKMVSDVQITALDILTIAVSFFTLWLIRRGYREKAHQLRMEEVIFLVFPALAGWITALMFRSTLYTMHEDIPKSLYDEYPIILIFEPLILLLLLGTIVSGIFLFQNLISRGRERQERELLEREVSGLSMQIAEIDRLNTDVRSLKHDMRNHISTISGLVEALDEETSGVADTDTSGSSAETLDRLKEYLTPLTAQTNSLETEISTGDRTVDTLLGMKYSDAKRRVSGIEFDVDGLLLADTGRVAGFDICVILGNAIDNALRAIEELSCADEKAENIDSFEAEINTEYCIQIRSYRRGKLLFIEIVNPCEDKTLNVNENGFPLTDRDETSGHGYGFLNMRRAALKYDGDIDWELKDGRFILTVMLQT